MAQLNNLIVTGSSRFLNKINGTCTDGSAGTTKYMRQDGTWQVPPNTTYTLSADTTNNKIKLTPSSGTAQSITVPYATSAGAATSAAKLTNTSKIGDTNKPVYFTASGVPSAISYTINKSVPSTAVFTDVNVTQTATTTNANYEVLFSSTADNTTRTEGARKSSGFIYNPYNNSLIVGSLQSGTTLSNYATAFGQEVVASGSRSHAEGLRTQATGYGSHAEGADTIASGQESHAEGSVTTASGHYSHAEGYRTIANHYAQHVFGEYNVPDPSAAATTERGTYIEIVGKGVASSARSNARTLDWDGNEWLANSLVIGSLNPETTIGTYATAFGLNIAASGNYSHAEGTSTTASGNGSHVEGNNSTASGHYSHAEGSSNASGVGSHAEGSSASSGQYSHSEGWLTNANHRSQHVFGENNILDTSTADATERGNYVEIVGNGTIGGTRSNARTLNWSGNEWIAGTLTQGSSIEIKKNVADMTQEDGDKILNLRPVVFDYKLSDKDIQAERGFIAEEVKEIIPNLVTDKIVNDEGETVAPASLNYIAMIPYLVKVCQRQQKEINDLKQQLNKTTN